MTEVKHVERSAVNSLQVLIHDIIKENNLKFYDTPLADSRIVTPKGELKTKAKYPDLIIENKNRKNQFKKHFFF